MLMLALRYMFITVVTNRLANNSANVFNSDLANMFNSDLVNIFTRSQASMFTGNSSNKFNSDFTNMFTSASANMFTTASANMFTSDLAKMFTSDLPNMFTSSSANMFTSYLANMFTSDWATGELEKFKKMIWPTCSPVKLTGEYVVPGIQHLIQSISQFFHSTKKEDSQTFKCSSCEKNFLQCVCYWYNLPR